jgi:large subunit ribosomal protein L15
MKLHEIIPLVKRKKPHRVGRGIAAGQGKTAGRGTKGQKARAGYNIAQRFEGGQTPLIQRLPKVGGFVSRSTRYPIVKVDIINKSFAEGERVSPQALISKGVLSRPTDKVKIVGPGKFNKFVRLENVILTKKLSASLPRLTSRLGKIAIKSQLKQKSKRQRRSLGARKVRKKIIRHARRS